MTHDAEKTMNTATKQIKELSMLISDHVSSGILLDDNVIKIMEDGVPLYMNIYTGSVDTLSGWDLDNNSGELVEVEWDEEEEYWKEV